MSAKIDPNTVKVCRFHGSQTWHRLRTNEITFCDKPALVRMRSLLYGNTRDWDRQKSKSPISGNYCSQCFTATTTEEWDVLKENPLTGRSD